MTYTLTNNEGKPVEVDSHLYNLLQIDFESGIWMTLIKVSGRIHSIILPDNF